MTSFSGGKGGDKDGTSSISFSLNPPILTLESPSPSESSTISSPISSHSEQISQKLLLNMYKAAGFMITNFHLNKDVSSVTVASESADRDTKTLEV